MVILELIVSQVSKIKGCEKLLQWVEPVRNHFWHCAETCKGDADSLKMSFIYLLTFIFTGRIQQ